MYGSKVQSMAEARSVVGELTVSPAGNVVLRIGRENDVGGGWHQTEHVVLVPGEAAELADELLALAAIDPRGDDVAKPADRCQVRASCGLPAGHSGSCFGGEIRLAPIDQDGERVDRPELGELVRLSPKRGEIIRPPRFRDHAEEISYARSLELLRIASAPIPGRDGWRIDAEGREWYSQDWLGRS